MIEVTNDQPLPDPFNPSALPNEAAWRAAHRRTTKRMTKPPSDEYRPPPSKNIAIG